MKKEPKNVLRSGLNGRPRPVASTKNKNLGRFDLNPLFNAKQESWYKEDAINSGGKPFDKSLVNVTENSDKFE
ncbi:hypothetical protein TIFTF001_031666 [Ficus carica]|uniref:Uncharacterized protein n=1 Tax=Ficus carica TaxID=3494 RepID=A0AA88J6M9_FICCA|nr:hypothetical protein TIFTF001_031666 [Ficus carica]